MFGELMDDVWEETVVALAMACHPGVHQYVSTYSLQRCNVLLLLFKHSSAFIWHVLLLFSIS